MTAPDPGARRLPQTSVPTPTVAHPRTRSLLLLAPPLILLTLFFAYPLAQILGSALEAGHDLDWLASDYVRARVAVALLQAVLSVLLTFAIALPLAYLHHRYRIPFRRVHLALHAAPFVLPVFVVVYGIQGVLGPNGWLNTLLHIDLLTRLGPLGAVVIAHAYYNYGFAARLLTTAFDRRPHRLEDAARTLGASPRQSFLRVSLPLLRHTILSVALLVFLFAFTSFGVVLLMGGGMVSTLETMLFQQLGGAFPRYPRAALLGVLQLVVNVVALSAYLTLRRRERRIERDPHVRRHAPRLRHRILATVALAAGLLPALTVLAGGFRVRNAWTLEPWRALLDPNHPAHLAAFALGPVLLRTLLYAASTMVLAVTLTLLLAYGMRRLRPTTRRATELFGAIPLGTSSILIGFGFLLAFGANDPLDLRGTTTLIIIAHTLIAFPFVARVLLPTLDLHDVTQDEAAALLGAGPWQVFRRIHLPQLRPALLVAAGLAAALSLGDFGASLILMRPDNMSLAVWIARHDRPFDPLMKAQAIALAGLLMVLAATAYLIVERFRLKQEVEF